MTSSSGLLLVDKPGAWTSHDVVARLRRLLNERRIGHAGTLDPMATGLLVVAVGPATRLLRFAQAETKRYRGTVQLGVATDSLDADGEVTQRAAVPALDEHVVNAAATAMLGPQSQVPPMVSALKVGGRRLHELAREGVEVERAAREIVIGEFTLTPGMATDSWDFEVSCSVGTYVRVLLSDLAVTLGTVGHLSALRRTASGRHVVEDAVTIDELSALDEPRRALRPAAELLESLDSVVLDEAAVVAMRRGQRVRLGTEVAGDELCALDGSGGLVGVLRRRGDTWQPDVVLPEEAS